jgi:CSLREA domain-containing protein
VHPDVPLFLTAWGTFPNSPLTTGFQFPTENLGHLGDVHSPARCYTWAKTLVLHEAPPSQRGAKVIEELIRPSDKRRRPLWWALFALLVLGSAVLLAISSGRARAATTFTVNSTGDEREPAASRGDGVCDCDPSATGLQCTLRAAIQEANALSGADTIEFNIGGTGALKTISLPLCCPS